MPDFLLLNIYSPDSLPSPTRTLAEKQHAQREHNKMNSMKNARSWVKTVYLASIIVISEGFSTRVHIIFRSQEKPSLDLSLQSSSCTSWRRGEDGWDFRDNQVFTKDVLANSETLDRSWACQISQLLQSQAHAGNTHAITP